MMKLQKAVACILAVILLCMVMTVPGTADSSRREEQLEKYEQMKRSTVHVTISNSGLYLMKSSKLYVRKVTGVDEEGNFILGGWERVYSESDVGMDRTDSVVVPGTGVCFAYSFDVRLGTDFPYSGVFLNDQTRDVGSVDVLLGGLVRMVECIIKIDGKINYSDFNCDSHTDWKP